MGALPGRPSAPQGGAAAVPAAPSSGTSLSVASPVTVLALVLAALLGPVWWPSPAGAIETEAFGIEPAEPVSGSRLPVEVRAGETTSTAVALRNKTGDELTLVLRAAPAHVGPDGTPVLGGDPAPAEWVRIEHDVVRLEAGARQVVTIDVEAPRSLPERATAAVVARPADTSGAGPAVLQEVGLVLRMTRTGPATAPAEPGILGTATGSPGGIAVAVAALALVVAGGGLRRVQRRRVTGVPAPA